MSGKITIRLTLDKNGRTDVVNSSFAVSDLRRGGPRVCDSSDLKIREWLYEVTFPFIVPHSINQRNTSGPDELTYDTAFTVVYDGSADNNVHNEPSGVAGNSYIGQLVISLHSAAKAGGIAPKRRGKA